LEETGFSAENCKLIGELHPLPGYIQSNAHIVRCDAHPDDTAETDRLEISEVHLMSWPDILNKIVFGEINEMQAVSAILFTKEFELAKKRAL